jgi:uncharacterized membrane protein
MTRLLTRWDLVLVWLLILAYVVTFGALSVLQNDAFATTVHDLGVMDQAAWNTLHGRFVMESSQEGLPLSRLRGHVEPIFLLISLVFLLFDHVNALLLLQTVVIALGALPVYRLAKEATATGQGSRFPAAFGVTAALAYLLYPPLEAANLTEFHPVALAPTFFLVAFLYLWRRAYWRYGLFALLAMSCKEDMPLLVVMLGVYGLVSSWRADPGPDRQAGLRWGAASVGVGAAWFLACIYLIVPAFSASGSYQLFQRYAEVGGGLSGLLSTLLTRPGAILAMLTEPARISYIAGLLAGTGFLSLLNPLSLLIAAPSLAINILSNYPVMYSGVSHYSAPLVPWVMVSAVLGVAWVRGRAAKLGCRAASVVSVASLAWLLAWVLGYHAAYGFTPLGGRFHLPQVTAHHRLAQHFLDQIPAGARLSTQPALFPHASHREFIYEFPTVADAEYVWLDVSSSVNMHPNDFKQQVDQMVDAGGFGIVDAQDGYILLKRDLIGPEQLPAAFCSFVVAGDRQPMFATDLTFGDAVRLVGFDLYETTEGGQAWTGLRTYWQALKPVTGKLRPSPFFFNDEGAVLEDTSQRPVVASIWCPASAWPVGQTVVMDKLPWPVGDRFNLGLGMTTDDWGEPGGRLVIGQALANGIHPEEGLVPLMDGNTWAHLATANRGQGELKVTAVRRLFAPPAMQYARPATLGSKTALLGYDLEPQGEAVRVTLYWQAQVAMDRSYTVFLQLVDGQGRRVSQADGLPAAGTRPTTTWAPGEVIADQRTLALSKASPSGEHRLVVGMYLLETMERLPVLDAGGQPAGDSVSLGVVDLAR